MWRDVIPKLAKTRRVIIQDLLNFGQSEKPESADVSMNAQSRMLVKLLDAWALPRRMADGLARQSRAILPG